MDAERPRPSAEQLLKGQFTLEDFLTQLREMRKLGPIQDLLKMLPGVPGGKNAMKDLAEPGRRRAARRAEAMILSMTPEERRNPAIIHGSRRLRIANGSGVTTSDVNGLLKDFEGARKMMRTMMGGKRMPGMIRRCRAGARPGTRSARPRTRRGTKHGDEDQAAADGREEATLLPGGGGRPAGSPRRPVHRERSASTTRSRTRR